jgi:hypothetical protein
MSFADLGITPTAMELVLEDYLWPYRPSGQYAEIKESAANLKVVQRAAVAQPQQDRRRGSPGRSRRA